MGVSESKILRVGLVGHGMIGAVHRAIYDRLAGAEVVAVADPRGDEVLRQGGADYVPGDAASAKKTLAVHASLDELLAAEDIDIIDICTPTPFHCDQAVEALEAGKHVLCEKPMGRTVADCDAIAEAAAAARGKFMVAHCLRFWPWYEYLHESVTSGEYGLVERARFFRQVIIPATDWYRDGKMSGGAIFDLHLHDVDAATWILGLPRALTAFGRIGATGCHDQVTSVWHYDDNRHVVLDAMWHEAAPVPFSASFEVTMENAGVTFDTLRDPALQLHVAGEKPVTPELDSGDGYFHEIDYFVRCVAEDRPIERATAATSRQNIALVELEVESIESGRTMEISID